MRQAGWRLVVKVVFDRLVAIVAGVALLPVATAIAVLVRVTLGSPVFFRQGRPGRHARAFELIKFRTMTDARDTAGVLLPDAERLTRVGRLLRATSLDELPQLWNVLRGDLSLVGPRPLLVRYLERYSKDQARRHDVLPGITGWAQVNGRNGLSWDEKLALDIWYVDHWGLALDLRILCRTIVAVCTRRGINREGNATMPEFLGSGPRGGMHES